jgi:hypothetical protein
MIALIDRTQEAGVATTLYDFCPEDMQFELPPYFRMSYDGFCNLAEPGQANDSKWGTTGSIHTLIAQDPC